MNSKRICPSCNTSLLLSGTVKKNIKCPKCKFEGDSSDFKNATKKIYCPHCSQAYQVRIDGKAKTITCQKCGKTELTSKFTDKPVEEPVDDMGNTKTNLGTNIGTYKPGKLILLQGSNKWIDPSVTAFTLSRGNNIIGRKTNTSSANIQLPTVDCFMSRNHTLIEVVMLKNSTFEHRLSDYKSVNGLYCNNIKLEKGDVVLLSHNDEIKMGHTILKFIIE